MLLQKALLLKADTIVSNERICDVSRFKDINFVNSEVYRIAGTFRAYDYNTKIIDKLYARYTSKFTINGINILKAIPKLIYWTNYKIGYLYACIQDKFDPKDIVYCSSYLPGNKWRESIKYLKYYASNNIRYIFGGNKSIENSVSDRSIGLLVNDEFELSVFEYLIKVIPPSDLVIFNYGNIDFLKYGYIGKEIQKVNISIIRKNARQGFVNPLVISVEELAVMNIIAKDWLAISSEIEQYKYIKSTSVKALIINVGENLPVKNLMTEIFGGGIRVYNTMNGMKSGEAHDGDVFFTKWLVWDEQMKKMLVGKCGLDPDMLSVTGHLMQDFVRDYQFRGLPGIEPQDLKDKKVISVFSVRGNREEKQETLKYLYDLAANDDSYFILVRPHPAESAKDYLLPEGIKNIHLVTYDWEGSKQSLYDQISLSDIGIVFGSTVAMECGWMNVSSVTFEKKEVSNVYCVDGINIKHVRSIEDLGSIIRALHKKQAPKGNEVRESVAEKILDLINHD